uniref:Protein FAR1-RELATED SEQUENCE 7 n=1 Tax=Cajanus cajan TaxID=3821 RepID=A0A151SEG9_CAJCA|nr:Protein FAR1-RELATED SEQUENCE 7 [Cajanus cajan]
MSFNNPLMLVCHTEDEEGVLQHLFWCDGISQLDYQVFVVVLVFDATYGKNKYMSYSSQPYNCFSSAIISNEWLLEQFLEVMKGKSPSLAITDGDLAIRNTIKKVFPNVHHRLCAWHLSRNTTCNVRNLTFIYEFRKCMLAYYDVGHFKCKSLAMVSKFGLEENSWVKDMYEKR